MRDLQIHILAHGTQNDAERRDASVFYYGSTLCLPRADRGRQ